MSKKTKTENNGYQPKKSVDTRKEPTGVRGGYQPTGDKDGGSKKNNPSPPKDE